jgi:hypothetical protein
LPEKLPAEQADDLSDSAPKTFFRLDASANVFCF